MITNRKRHRWLRSAATGICLGLGAALLPAAAATAVVAMPSVTTVSDQMPNFASITGAVTTLPGTKLKAYRVTESVTDTSQVYIYARAGERVNVALISELTDPNVTEPGSTSLKDPTGAVAFDTQYLIGERQEFGGIYTSDVDGVWILEIADSAANNRFRYTSAALEWNIAVTSDETTALPGRIWSSAWALTQQDMAAGTVPVLDDLAFTMLSAQGAKYEVKLPGYNGFDSAFTANTIGNAVAGECEPAEKSVPGAPSNESGGIGTNYWQPLTTDCDMTEYRLFLDAPSSALPASIGSWADGRSTETWGSAEYVAAAISDLRYERSGSDSNAGSLRGTVTQPGWLSIAIDVDGNGSFTDDVDITARQFEAEAGSFSYRWNGVDGNGEAVPVTAEGISMRVQQHESAPIHFLRSDSEVSNGLEIRQLVGPNVGDTTLYWDDSLFADTSGDRFSFTDPITSGSNGVNSAGGVHGWGDDDSGQLRGPNKNDGQTGSWGDFRIINDWTHIEESAEATTTLAPLSAELKIHKTTVGEPTVHSSGKTATVQWTVQVGNVGSATARETVVTDTYPRQLVDGTVEIVEAPTAGEFDVETGIWSIGDMAAGATAEVTFKGNVRLTNGAETKVTNSAIVDSPDSPYVPGEECVPNDDLGSDTDQCDDVTVPFEPRSPELLIHKDVVGEPVISDDGKSATIQWMVEVGNVGTSTASRTVVSDTYPEEIIDGTVEIVEAPTMGEFDAATGIWTIGNLPAGATAQVTFVAQVQLNYGAETSVTNAAYVDSPDSPYVPGEECIPNDDLGSDTDQCDDVTVPFEPRAAELQIHKDVVGEPVISDDGKSATIQWTVQVGNVGTATAVETTVTDTYPEQIIDGTVEIIEEPTMGEFDPETGIWMIGDLAAGEVVEITFQAEVELDRSTETTVTNSAIVDSPDSPYVPGEECIPNDDLGSDTDQCDNVTVPFDPEIPEPGAPTLPKTGSTVMVSAIVIAILAFLGAIAMFVIHRRRQLSQQ